MNRFVKTAGLAVVLMISHSFVRADTPRLSLSLDQAVQSSLENSEQWKSYRSTAESAEAQALVAGPTRIFDAEAEPGWILPLCDGGPAARCGSRCCSYPFSDA
jgi:hypothetical protein